MNIIKNIINTKNPDGIAIVDGDKVLTYAELLDLSYEYSLFLEKATQNVIVYSNSNLEYIVSLLSVWMSGKTVVSIPGNMSDREINQILKSVESNTILLTNDTENNPKSFEDKEKIIIEHTTNLKSYDNSSKFVSYENLAMIVPTSGSTDVPKLVEVSHENLILKAKEIVQSFMLDKEDVEITILPVTTLSILTSQCLPILFQGGKLVIYNKPINAKLIGKEIKDYKATFTGMTPTLLKILLKSDNLNTSDFKNLKSLALGGESITNELLEYASEKLGNLKIISLYGLTETLTTIVGNIKDPHPPIGSVGKIQGAMKSKVIDEKGQEVSLGNPGELSLKSRTISKGYYNNVELNESLYDGEWLLTGDIVRQDKQGYLYILGRKKNVIISSGHTVFAEEVENYISSHHNVDNCLVYAEKDDLTGEAIVAKVVLKNDDFKDKKELEDFIKKGITNYKVPKKLIFTKSFKIRSFGKLDRNDR